MILFLNILGQLWLSPVSLIGFLTGLVLQIFGQVKLIEFKENAFDWEIVGCSWLEHDRRNWTATTIGNSIFYHKKFINNKKTRNHEKRHVQQGMVFGIFFIPVYIVFSWIIKFFYKKLSPYRDNPFEKDARDYADRKEKL